MNQKTIDSFSRAYLELNKLYNLCDTQEARHLVGVALDKVKSARLHEDLLEIKQRKILTNDK